MSARSDPSAPDAVLALLDDLDARVRRARGYLIARHQVLTQRRVQITNGRLEEVSSADISGLGLQVFSRDGRSAFASLDFVDGIRARRAVDALLVALKEASRRRHDANREVFDLSDTSAVVQPEPRYPLDHLPLRQLVRTLAAINRTARRERRGLKVETSFTIRREDWTVSRSDGTRSCFRMPRATATNHVTVIGDDGRALSASASGSTPSYEILLDDGPRLLLETRTRTASARLLRLQGAPYAEAGSYPFVIDYALAKGLAHEAVGHASESDSYGSSCLARDGRFQVGLTVAIPALSLIDEPIYGDHAYQPVSANGVPRRRATIVKEGKLHEGLSDVFTARPGGVPLTGAGRAETYRSIPLPRMTNIRIDLSDARPLPRPFTEMEPEDVRDLLAASGLLEPDRPVAYLSGYRGGQVNSMRGDFVFNCGAIYLLRPNGVEVCRPAIFSGVFLSALGAVRAGFGPLILDAVGMCGKWGQRVPSSGGSNALLYLEPRPDVTIGGRG